MRLNLRVALILLIGLVAAGGLWSGLQAPGSEGVDRASKASLKSVTLVLDFGADSGRQVKTLKVDNLEKDASGWDVIVKSGTVVRGTSQYPTGFVCRLDGWPSEESQDCEDTPAFTDGHWAYFVTSKKLGDGWLLSGQGAASHISSCGEFEGWKWVGSGEDVTPPAVLPAVGDCQP
ncbi:unannotated protein [freshwater metagenome]|uniref:Unannotated protein n=1 Tax=freshwater metagenome TaxID=449393 RepID=A0A6J6JCE1_9ZZZZ|nr:hypothetical protein [Actinomycetota bacterium]